METTNVRNDIINWLVAHGGTDNGTTVMDFGGDEFGDMSQVLLRASQVFIGPCFDEEYKNLASTDRPVQVGVLVEHNLNLTDEQYLAIDLFESTLPSQITCEVGNSINDDLWLIRNFENSQSEVDTLDAAMTELVGAVKTMYKQFGHMPNAPLIKLRETSR
jgi:hypothetical protein